MVNIHKKSPLLSHTGHIHQWCKKKQEKKLDKGLIALLVGSKVYIKCVLI